MTTIKLDAAVPGGGFAGVYCAKALSEAMKAKGELFKVGLISSESTAFRSPVVKRLFRYSINHTGVDPIGLEVQSKGDSPNQAIRMALRL